MTEKENFMLVINGREPAWVPRYGIMNDSGTDYKPATAMTGPGFLRGEKGRDIFGVEYTATESTGGMILPTPNRFILDDIRKWRDVIKVPDISNIDWETAAKKDTAHIDRNETAVILGTHVGYFQHLINFMGFTEGLCALLEEPDEVLALNEYLADFYDEVTRKAIRYYKPDILSITDDNATAQNPFFSMQVYRTLYKPYQARLGHIAMEAGIPVDIHDCGRCEDLIDDWLEFGVRLWNPAQVMNDLTGIKKKYGNRLVLVGCWDSSGPAGWPGASEELVRGAVRKCIDTFAPGGGFCFWGGVYGPTGDPEVKRRAGWITDEYNKYGRSFYQKIRN